MNTEFEMELPGKKSGADQILVALVILLTGLGLVTLYSSSFAFAQRFFSDGYYFISRQIVLCGAGVLLFIIASIIDLDLLRRLVKPLVIGSILLCILTFIPGIGETKNGAARWIKIGSFTYQPSELVKLVLPLYLAHFFDKKKEKLDILSSGIIPPALITGVFFVLIFL